MKLRALVSEHRGAETPEPTTVGTGAFLRIPSGDDAGECWAYRPEAPAGTLGQAVVWAHRNGCSELNVVFDDMAAEMAFVAEGYRAPHPRVWIASGRSLRSAEPKRPEVPEPPACTEFAMMMRDAGLDVVADHGVWIGEINGLELARVGERDGECTIDIGVGAYDQFAASALQRGDPAAKLRQVVDMVRPHRTAHAEPHPLGRLVRSRWLRAQALRSPGLVDVDELAPIPLLQERPGLMETQPAAAIALRGNARVLMIFTVGIDVAVSETAAALSRLHEPDEVIVVLPERDRHPAIVASVELVAAPASVITLEGEWAD